MNTPAEEAAIQRGIALDPDNPELGDDFWANARPAREVMPKQIYEALVARQRGRGKKPAKQLLTLRLDREVVERLRASGPGWQTRVNEMLTKALAETA